MKSIRRRNVGDTERIWTGVAGAALLGGAMTTPTLAGRAVAAAAAMMLHRSVTGYCPLYGAMEGGPQVERPDHSKNTVVAHAPKVDCSVRIQASADELYRFWRNFENLPHFMSHVRSVHQLDGKKSRWTVDGPMGMPVSWEAEIYNEIPDRLIAWRSCPGSTVAQAGSVRFLPVMGGAFTDVKVSLQYSPPMGRIGAKVSQILGSDPQKQIEEDLQRLRTMMEAELTRSSLDRM